jgi:hypothetical protein
MFKRNYRAALPLIAAGIVMTASCEPLDSPEAVQGEQSQLVSETVSSVALPADASSQAPAPTAQAPSAAATTPSPQAENWGLRVYRVSGVSTREARTAVSRTGAAIDEIGADYVIIDCHPETANQIRALGYQVEDITKPLAVAPMAPVAPMSLVSGYHTYGQMVTEINQAVKDHPTLVKVFTIGKSYQGRDIWAAKITYDGDGNGDYKPEALFIGGQHAREHIGVEMTLYLLKLLTDNFSTDMRIQNVVVSNQIYIIFNANPDGSEYDIANPPTDSGAGWRKNRQPNAGLPDVLTNWGTDLNRNFGYNWGCCGSEPYVSTDATQPTYIGPWAFSAPEDQVIRDFIGGRMLGVTQRIRTGIAFHSHAKAVQWPFGYTYDNYDMLGDDNSTFVTMGGLMAQSNGYTAQQSSAGYMTSGDVSDWAYGTQGIFMYTFEMGDGGNAFYPPSSSIDSLTSVHKDAVLQLLENTACPQKASNLEAWYCRKTSWVQKSVWVAANSYGSVTAVCPNGSVVVGGGYQGVSNVIPHNSAMYENGWIASGKNTGAGTSLVAYAICLWCSGGTSSWVVNQVTIPKNTTSGAEATCPSGSFVTSGGFTAPSDQSMKIIQNFKSSGNGWRVLAKNTASSSKSLAVYATCLSGPNVTVTEVSQDYAIPAGVGVLGGGLATCPAGQILAGGGWATSGPNVKSYLSNITTTMDGWNAGVFNTTSNQQPFSTYAMCLSFNDTFFSVNDDDPSISYHGTWTYLTGRTYGDYRQDLHWTPTNSDSFEYNFSGTGFDYITEKNSTQGKVEVYIDGKLDTTVNCYNASLLAQQVVYRKRGLAWGTHTIKVSKKDGGSMYFDALKIYQ